MASHGISRSAAPLICTEEARQKELQEIIQYKELASLVNNKIAKRDYAVDVLALVTKLLKENPEYYTIWNHRRRLLNSLVIKESSVSLANSFLQEDLQLTSALLRKFPKCYWIWNHRDWLLRKAELILGVQAAQQYWSGELQLINKMLHADSRNFHAWGYRRFVVKQIERLLKTTPTSEQDDHTRSLSETEFDYTTKMIKANLSNFSGWHNRSQLIPRIMTERRSNPQDRRALLGSELALICEAINTDPFDQSIWFYHQYLLHTISPSCPSDQLIVQDLTNSERQTHYQHEMQYIKDILEDETDCKWIYEALLRLATAYREIDACTGAVTAVEMKSWLQELQRLDPLRRGRWEDLGRALNL